MVAIRNYSVILANYNVLDDHMIGNLESTYIHLQVLYNHISFFLLSTPFSSFYSEKTTRKKISNEVPKSLNLHNIQLVKMGTVQPSTATQSMQFPGYISRPAAPLPVISAVSSLAVGNQQAPLQQPIQVQTQTVREVVKETHVLPAEVSVMKNKGMQTKPYMMTKGVSCRPHPCHKETQTEGLSQPVPRRAPSTSGSFGG